ncbi:hypothetical protein FB381_4595 [Nocardioides albertanoniae]|uniref:Uncharacterized protein n=1 Tax=Nocardioides albertanoniae TaxID=1175486 RepID=A0A543ADS6_9ACTN|nr:hypothetical protein [Nocardioides albertanoniae]TQL70656.1 hypothetical protein FB381_4595 [Nocardioides albertanoniae]
MPRHRLVVSAVAIAGLVAVTFAVVALTTGGGDRSSDRGGERADVEPLPALGVLGANYNENLDQLDFRELRQARASWVRGFYPLPEADRVPPSESETITAVHEAHDRGLRTVLSLKFPKSDSSFPSPGSKEMAAELARLDRVLPTVLGTVDVVTIGNEPFIESRRNERDQRLNRFYEAIARHVIEARAELCGGAGCSTHLFMGALNRLDLAANRTPAVERYLAFVRKTPEIEGVDLHPHVPDEARIQDFLDYTLPRLRPEQTFLVTEFSLVSYWKRHMTDRIPAAFARRYAYAPDTEVWQVIGDAIEHPFRSRKWNELLAQSPWFESKKHLLRDEMARFRGTGRLAVATYGFPQISSMTANWSATKTPWLLNSVFASLTVQPHGRTSTPGYAWIDDFRRLQ